LQRICRVVVEILSHAGEIVDDRDLKPVEQLSFSYAGQLQQLREPMAPAARIVSRLASA